MSAAARPTRLGKYDVRGTLGHGAMGTVYDGWDPVIARRVAIKTVRLLGSQDDEALESLGRFKREAQAAGRLSHPNIVGLYDYGETDELAFIVMEFVEGRSLKDILGASERIPVATLLRLMDDVLAGLEYSHERGVIHRDIKPANVMVTAGDRAKIADFGIARIEQSNMTQAGTVMGTPAYMSPEQFMGQVVDRRTDIYSCGVLLYQLLTGDRPFDGSMTAIMHKALSTTPPRPSELSVTAPPALDWVVAKAMARRPEDRFETAAAFAQALRAPGPAPDATVIAARPVVAPASMPVRAAPAAVASAPPRKTSWVPVLAGSAAVLLVAGAGAWFLLPGKNVAPPLQQLESSQTPAAPAAPVGPVVTQAPMSPPAAASANPEPVRPPLVPAAPDAPAPSGSESAAKPPSVVPVAPGGPDMAAPAPAVPVQVAAAGATGLLSALPSLSCSLVRAGTDGARDTTVTGITGKGEPEQALNRVAQTAGLAPAHRQWVSVDGVFCPAIDLLREAAEANRTRPALDAAQIGGPSSLHDNDVIALQVTMPGFAGYLHAAYLQHDATVLALVPSPFYPSQTYAARTRLEFGRQRGDFPGWLVGPPFGTDMIVVVASTAPLFSRARPASGPLDSYLRDLQAAIEGLRRRGGSVSVAAVPLDTLPGN